MTMAAVTVNYRHRADSVIGVIWALGMAIGIVFLDLTPGYHADLMSYLFGSILTVPVSDLMLMACMAAFNLLVVVFLYSSLLSMSYDEEFTKLRGVPVGFLFFLMVGMIAVSVVLMIRVVGLILVIALLTIPPMIAERYSRSLFGMMVLSAVLSGLFTTGGLWLSFAFNLTSGATIILFAGTAFFLSMAFRGSGQKG
jgi:zinc transport system permease protein